MKKEATMDEQLIHDLERMRLRLVYLETTESILKDKIKAFKDELKFYRHVADEIECGIIVRDEQARFTYVNKALCRILGYSREELLGKATLDFLDEKNKGVFLSQWEKLKSGQKTAYEIAANRKDGTKALMRITAEPVLKDNGVFMGALALIVDISREAEVKRIIEDSRDYYHKLIDDLPVPVWRTNAEGKGDYLNKAWLAFTGEPYSHGDWTEGIHPDDREASRLEFLSAFTARKQFCIEYRRCRNDGNYRNVVDTGIPFYDTKGGFVGYIGTFYDITERKLAEREFRTLVENSPDAIIRFNRELRPVYVNPAITRITGLPAAKFGQRTKIRALPQELLSQWNAALQSAVSLGKEESIEFNFDGRGGERYYQARVVPEFGKNGQVETVFTVSRDVTERVEAEQKLENRIKIERIVTALSSQFINMKHDEVDKGIRNALKTIGIFLGVDMSFMLVYSGEPRVITSVYEWHSDAVKPRIDELLGLSALVFPWIYGKIAANQVVRYADISGMPPEAEAEKKLWESLGVKSLINIPLFYDGLPAGMIGFNTVNRKKEWNNDDVKLLRVTGAMLINAIQRKSVLRALKESEEKYKTIFENTGTSIVLLDEEANIVLVNRQFEQLTGYSWEDIKNKKGIGWFVTKDEMKRVMEFHALRINHPEAAPERYETKVVLKSGIAASIIMNIGFIRSTKQTVISAVDITPIKKAEDKLKITNEKLYKAINGVITVIGKIVETRDPYTSGHEERVSQFAVAIGRELGLPGDRLEGLRIAAVIHDVGKIFVPAEILSKPGKLSEAEIGIIRIHPSAGYEILKVIDFPWPIAQIAYQHQERFNGSGYPLGISGKDILIEARILAVADTFESMTFRRPYRSEASIDKAFEEIKKNSGTLYDPEVAAAALELIKEGRFKF